MIDTHCHIYLPQFKDDIKSVLDRAAGSGISDILMPAISYDSDAAMDALSHDTIRFHKMAGIHPCDVESAPLEKKLSHWAENANVIAIGESGLDYYWSTEHVEHQKRSFRLHCRLARELDKPIVIHNRDSTEDMLGIIEQEQDGRLKGIWHCFNGSTEEGKKAIDLGLHLGIGGVVTFKNAGVDKSVASLPLNAMVLETDAPYLAPVPHRGKRNEPAYTALVAIKLSELFGLELREIDAITSRTARELFRIPE